VALLLGALRRPVTARLLLAVLRAVAAATSANSNSTPASTSTSPSVLQSLMRSTLSALGSSDTAADSAPASPLPIREAVAVVASRLWVWLCTADADTPPSRPSTTFAPASTPAPSVLSALAAAPLAGQQITITNASPLLRARARTLVLQIVAALTDSCVQTLPQDEAGAEAGMEADAARMAALLQWSVAPAAAAKPSAPSTTSPTLVRWAPTQLSEEAGSGPEGGCGALAASLVSEDQRWQEAIHAFVNKYSKP
jgi:hypothetical protein